ncbi:ABC transporter permease [Mangrovactinospora gilvigrisea]|uniref:ABC transporter permease n=2 Tax=Mangrovactinospora gilvigrisea TaxID=1428644 RepID=A0A1J7C765_9ACTN|nr:ABC transporter permease [Mangrovactinospora gilvigrisea]
MLSLYIVLAFFLAALLAPVVSMLYGKNPYTQYGVNENLLNSFGYPLKPNGGISGQFWFGLEPPYGKDVFTELFYGMRTSIGIGVALTILIIITSVVLGLLAGYLGGWVDYVVMRVADLLMAFPQQLFFIAFIPVLSALFFSPRVQTPTWFRVTILIVVMWFLSWMAVARILRSAVLSMREREFVEAAKLSGASTWRIIRKEILPNMTTPIVVQGTLLLPTMVSAEAGLSFLGVGVQQPTPDWGRMFQTGAAVYQSDITYMVFPTVTMIVFVIAFNLLGDSVRDALDPKSAR